MALDRSGHRILVIRALGLGDLLTAVPALRALRRGFPGSQLILAAPDWLAALIPLIGAVDRLQPTPNLKAVRNLGPAPDLVVNLHGSGPQSIEAALRLTPRAVLTHAHPAFPELSGPPWDAELHEVDRWCRLLRWAGLTADIYELGLAPPPALHAELPAAGGRCAPDGGGRADPGVSADNCARWAIVHPGAATAARRWPVDRFAAVAASLADHGLTVLVTASAAEQGLAEQVARGAGRPGVRSVAGRVRLDQLAGLVATARLVVCGDTGVAHLATAYGTPSVVLFGPTPPSLWGPPPSGQHRVLWRGERGDPHADQPDPGLLAIEVDEVLAAAEDLVTALPRG